MATNEEFVELFDGVKGDSTLEPTTQRVGETKIVCPFCKKQISPRYNWCTQCAGRIDNYVRELKKKEKQRPKLSGMRKIYGTGSTGPR